MKIGEKEGEGVFKEVPWMNNSEVAAFNVYLSLIDRGLISKKTLTEKFGFDFKEEQKQIKSEKD